MYNALEWRKNSDQIQPYVIWNKTNTLWILKHLFQLNTVFFKYNSNIILIVTVDDDNM